MFVCLGTLSIFKKKTFAPALVGRARASCRWADPAAQVEADLAREAPALRAALEEAVLARYLPESQLRALALPRDPQVAAAVTLALDRPKYDALLRPPTTPPTPAPSLTPR
jgi:hypothetical protein